MESTNPPEAVARATASIMTDVAMALDAEGDHDAKFQLAVELAVAHVPGCDDASVSVLMPKHEMMTPAVTATETLRLDQLQYLQGEGPAVTAVRTGELVSVPDVEAERRWPSWSSVAATSTSVRSMLCFGLSTPRRSVGALSLYAHTPHAFTSVDVEIGSVIATQMAVAINAAEDLAHLRAALATRHLIGQAQGILMDRHGLDSDRAFAVLRRISQDSNRKLREVAAELVETGHLHQDDSNIKSDRAG